MFAKPAEYITEQLVSNGTITDNDQRDIVKYGLEIGLSHITTTLTVVVIGILFSSLLEAFLFLICFAVLRCFAGGYHANSGLVCYLISCGMMVAVLFLIPILAKLDVFVIPIMLVLGAIPIFIFSPVSDKNKPIESSEVPRLRKTALIILLVEMLITIGFYLFGLYYVALIVALSIFTVGMATFAGAVRMRKNEHA